jgi:orotidine-5'-phosphate decarboxylase
MNKNNAADRLFKAIDDAINPVAMGLDTQVSHLPMEFGTSFTTDADKAAAILRYNERLLDLMEGIIPCVKVQAAYYEQYGLAGMNTFAQTLGMARSLGYVTIADVKRNDIGATSEAYARAYLQPGADFEADFITVNAYLGVDGIAPFVAMCKEYGKGLFVLVKTSNPSSGQLQDLRIGNKAVYEMMGDFVAEWGADLVGECGYSSVGAVVGATYPTQGTELRARLPQVPFLVPGYGAQGGTARDLCGCFGADGLGAVVNASRSLIAAHKKDAPGGSWRQGVVDEAFRMRDDIHAALRGRGE